MRLCSSCRFIQLTPNQKEKMRIEEAKEILRGKYTKDLIAIQSEVNIYSNAPVATEVKVWVGELTRYFSGLTLQEAVSKAIENKEVELSNLPEAEELLTQTEQLNAK